MYKVHLEDSDYRRYVNHFGVGENGRKDAADIDSELSDIIKNHIEETIQREKDYNDEYKEQHIQECDLPDCSEEFCQEFRQGQKSKYGHG